MAKGYFFPVDIPPTKSKFFVDYEEEDVKDKDAQLKGKLGMKDQVEENFIGRVNGDKNIAGEEFRSSERVTSPAGESVAIRMEDCLDVPPDTNKNREDTLIQEENKMLVAFNDNEGESPIDSGYQGFDSSVSSTLLRNEENVIFENLPADEIEFRALLYNKKLKEIENIKREEIAIKEMSKPEIVISKKGNAKKEKCKHGTPPRKSGDERNSPPQSTSFGRKNSWHRDHDNERRRSREVVEREYRQYMRNIMFDRTVETMQREFPELNKDTLWKIKEQLRTVNKEFTLTVMRNLCRTESILHDFLNEQLSEDLIILNPRKCGEFELELHKKYITTYKTQRCMCSGMTRSCFGYHTPEMDMRRVPLMFSSSKR